MKTRLLSRSPFLRRNLVCLLLALFALILAFPAAAAEKVFPEKHHNYLSRVISRILTKEHYNHVQLSDSLSSEIYDRYIEALDYNRYFFLQSDITRFEQYRNQLDDLIIAANLNPVYDIFNTFSDRVKEREDNVHRRIDQPFIFTKDEYYDIDRDNRPWANTPAELDERWRQRLKYEALSLNMAGKDEAGVKETLHNRYKNYFKRLIQYDSEDVFELFMNALAQSMDPHTNYFSPFNAEDFGIRMKLSFEGIGASLVQENDHTKVVRILPGGPADLDKRLQPNDLIIGVDENNDGNVTDVVGWKLEDVVQLIRGPKGSQVRLQIIPGGAIDRGEISYILLTRDKVRLEEREAKADTVKFRQHGHDFTMGVISIPTFYLDYEAQARGERDYKSVSRDVERLIKELEAKNIDGLVIDLRGNGGGSLPEAIDLTGLFIDSGPVVQVRHSSGYLEVERTRNAGIAYKGPLLVMIDRLSASASEIFAAAIQDYGRGLIVGGQSFGKGTVQKLESLDRDLSARRIVASTGGSAENLGRLKVTIAKFYRITGESTQHRGVIPDIPFPSRYSEMDLGEDSNVNALIWDQIRPTRFKKYENVDAQLPKLRMAHTSRANENLEFKFLREDIEDYRKMRAQKQISLQEAKRRAERKQNEQERLERENARRKAKGLPPLKEGEKPDDDEDENARDFLVKESMRILADKILIAKGELITSTKKAANQ